MSLNPIFARLLAPFAPAREGEYLDGVERGEDLRDLQPSEAELARRRDERMECAEHEACACDECLPRPVRTPMEGYAHA